MCVLCCGSLRDTGVSYVIIEESICRIYSLSIYVSIYMMGMEGN